MTFAFKPSGISAKLVAMIETPNGSRFALAKKEDETNESRAYVTWQVTDEGDCFWGHYDMSFKEGLIDLNHRALPLSEIGE